MYVDLLQIQRSSFLKFLQNGIYQVFDNMNPILIANRKYLFFSKYYLLKIPSIMHFKEEPLPTETTNEKNATRYSWADEWTFNRIRTDEMLTTPNFCPLKSTVLSVKGSETMDPLNITGTITRVHINRLKSNFQPSKLASPRSQSSSSPSTTNFLNYTPKLGFRFRPKTMTRVVSRETSQKRRFALTKKSTLKSGSAKQNPGNIAHLTYSSEFYIPVQILDQISKKVYLRWLLLADLPIMTKRGHFIINGYPKTVINQIVRSPGIRFKNEDDHILADIISMRGAWMGIQIVYEKNLKPVGGVDPKLLKRPRLQYPSTTDEAVSNGTNSGVQRLWPNTLKWDPQIFKFPLSKESEKMNQALSINFFISASRNDKEDKKKMNLSGFAFLDSLFDHPYFFYGNYSSSSINSSLFSPRLSYGFSWPPRAYLNRLNFLRDPSPKGSVPPFFSPRVGEKKGEIEKAWTVNRPRRTEEAWRKKSGFSNLHCTTESWLNSGQKVPFKLGLPINSQKKRPVFDSVKPTNPNSARQTFKIFSKMHPRASLRPVVFNHRPKLPSVSFQGIPFQWSLKRSNSKRNRQWGATSQSGFAQKAWSRVLNPKPLEASGTANRCLTSSINFLNTTNFRDILFERFMNPKFYDIGYMGRKRLNKKLRLNIPLACTTLTPLDFLAVFYKLFSLYNSRNLIRSSFSQLASGHSLNTTYSWDFLSVSNNAGTTALREAQKSAFPNEPLTSPSTNNFFKPRNDLLSPTFQQTGSLDHLNQRHIRTSGEFFLLQFWRALLRFYQVLSLLSARSNFLKSPYSNPGKTGRHFFLLSSARLPAGVEKDSLGRWLKTTGYRGILNRPIVSPQSLSKKVPNAFWWGKTQPSGSSFQNTRDKQYMTPISNNLMQILKAWGYPDFVSIPKLQGSARFQLWSMAPSYLNQFQNAGLLFSFRKSQFPQQRKPEGKVNPSIRQNLLASWGGVKKQPLKNLEKKHGQGGNKPPRPPGSRADLSTTGKRPNSVKRSPKSESIKTSQTGLVTNIATSLGIFINNTQPVSWYPSRTENIGNNINRNDLNSIVPYIPKPLPVWFNSIGSLNQRGLMGFQRRWATTAPLYPSKTTREDLMNHDVSQNALDLVIKKSLYESKELRRFDAKERMRNLETKLFNGVLKEFLNLDPLSQDLDETNGLSEIIHQRRISALGKGGVTSKNAPLSIRSIHPSFYGRLCPIDSPEGDRVGLINSLTNQARISSVGLIATPFYRTRCDNLDQEFSQSAEKVPDWAYPTKAQTDLALPEFWTSSPNSIVPAAIQMRICPPFAFFGQMHKTVPNGSRRPPGEDSKFSSPYLQTNGIPNKVSKKDALPSKQMLFSSTQAARKKALPVSSRRLNEGSDGQKLSSRKWLFEEEKPVIHFYDTHYMTPPITHRENSLPNRSPAFLKKSITSSPAKSISHSTTKAKPMVIRGPMRSHSRRTLPNTLQSTSDAKQWSLSFPSYFGPQETMAEAGTQTKQERRINLPYVKTIKTPTTSFLTCYFDFLSFQGYAPVTSFQFFSPGVGLIPFLEHDDGTRALMGANMQRQAVPLIMPTRPIVGTGLEKNVAACLILSSNNSGYTYYMSGKQSKQIRIYDKSPYRSPWSADTKSRLGIWLGCFPETTHSDPFFFSFVPPKFPSLFDYRKEKRGKNGGRGGKRLIHPPKKHERREDHAIEKFENRRNIKRPFRLAAPFHPNSKGNSSRTRMKLKETSALAVEKANRNGAVGWEAPQPTGPDFFISNTHWLPYRKSYKATCIQKKPAIQENSWVQKGDVLVDSTSSINGELALGRNLFSIYMPWEGYNFEDAILISDKAAQAYSTIHIEEFSVKISKNENVSSIIKPFSWVNIGDILVSKKRKLENEYIMNRLLFGMSSKPKMKASGSLPFNDQFGSLSLLPVIENQRTKQDISLPPIRTGVNSPGENQVQTWKKAPSPQLDTQPSRFVTVPDRFLDSEASPNVFNERNFPVGFRHQPTTIQKTTRPIPWHLQKHSGPSTAGKPRSSLVSDRGYRPVKKKSISNDTQPEFGWGRHRRIDLLIFTQNSVPLKEGIGFHPTASPVSLPYGRETSISVSRQALSDPVKDSYSNRFSRSSGSQPLENPKKKHGQSPWTKLDKTQISPNRLPRLIHPAFAEGRSYAHPLNLNLSQNRQIETISEKQNLVNWRSKGTDYGLESLKKRPDLVTSNKNEDFEIDTSYRTGESISGWVISVKPASNTSVGEGWHREKSLNSKAKHVVEKNRQMASLKWSGLVKDLNYVSKLSNSSFFRYSEFLHELGDLPRSRKPKFVNPQKGRRVLKHRHRVGLFPQKQWAVPRKKGHGSQARIFFGESLPLIKSLGTDQKARQAGFGRGLKRLNGTSLPKGTRNEPVLTAMSLFKRLDDKTHLKQQHGETTRSSNETISIYIAVAKPLVVGDKMSGRHGNKGIISKILPFYDMPYLMDGTPIDIILNPLGVPSRMNVGQIYESLLGLTGFYKNEYYRLPPFDENYGSQFSPSFVYKRLDSVNQLHRFGPVRTPTETIESKQPSGGVGLLTNNLDSTWHTSNTALIQKNRPALVWGFSSHFRKSTIEAMQSRVFSSNRYRKAGNWPLSSQLKPLRRAKPFLILSIKVNHSVVSPFVHSVQAKPTRTVVKNGREKTPKKQDRLAERMGLNPYFPGKMRLLNGLTGETFFRPIIVGKSYMLKLIHLVHHKIHARATGPYALITQQPLKGKRNQGGQRMGEMEIWALYGFGSASILYEMLTIKSDDPVGRERILREIVKGNTRKPNDAISTVGLLQASFLKNESNLRFDSNDALEKGIAESFRVLVMNLRALCLDMQVFKDSV